MKRQMNTQMMVLISCSLMAASAASAGGAGAKPSAAPAQTAACMSIADTVMNTAQFSTLLTALQAADLVDTLKGGQYTVFAPTDDAFNKVPSDVLAGVLNDPELLKSVLLYHVVPGKVNAKQVMSLKSVKTAQGGTLSVSMMGSKVMINGANVVQADVMACNGIIHIVNTLLLPPMTAMTPPPAPAAEAPAAEEPMTDAASDEMTSDDGMATDDMATDAMPTEDAAAADDMTADNGMSDDAVMDEAAPSDTAADEAATDSQPAATPPAPADPIVIPPTPLTMPADMTMEEGGDAAAETTDETTDTAMDTATDESTAVAETTAAETTAVETPAATDTAAADTTTTDMTAETTEADAATTDMADASMAETTIYDVLVNDDRFVTLRSLISDAGLSETLMGGEYTLFAPTDEAFAKVDADTLAKIAADPALLKQVLLYHVVAGKMTGAQVTDATQLASAEGQSLNVMNSGDSVKLGDATITAVDMNASNGVVHVIDTVLIPADLQLP